jgi:hypothetical protein
VQAGNLAGLEVTLTAQAVALDATFNELARRAAANMGDYFNATEIYLRLGLKGASTMPGDAANIGRDQEPAVAFVRQAHIANGPHRSITDCRRAACRSRAGISTNSSNELLGGHP